MEQANVHRSKHHLKLLMVEQYPTINTSPKPSVLQHGGGGHRQTNNDRHNPCFMSPDSTRTDTQSLCLLKRVSASTYVIHTYVMDHLHHETATDILREKGIICIMILLIQNIPNVAYHTANIYDLRGSVVKRRTLSDIVK